MINDKFEPLQNTYVKVLFKNGTQIEGFVFYWSDSKSVLKFDTGMFIIQNTKEDVISIKIDSTKTIIKEPIKKINIDLENTIESNLDNPNKINKIIDLKKLLAEEEKKEIADKLKDHYACIGTPRKINYELPRTILKKPIPK